MRLHIGYPDSEAEKRILTGHRAGEPIDDLRPVLSLPELLALQKSVRQVAVEESLTNYLLEIVNSTRNHRNLYLGASTRAALSLYRAAQARALVEGREYVVPDDIKLLAVPVLAHRILPKSAQPGGSAEHAEEIVRGIVEQAAIPV
jgi:MoxR-like ATPase